MGLRLYWIAVKASHHSTVRRVLEVMAAVACEECGLAWPGMPFMVENTQVGVRAVQRAIKQLTDSGEIKVHAFPHGGRRRSTQYVVLPNQSRSSSTCRVCQLKLVGTNGKPPNTDTQQGFADENWFKNRPKS